MTITPCFAGNPFATRADVASSALYLLENLGPYTSPGGARIKLGSTGTHYDEVAAQLEGFSRPLWALVPLIAGGHIAPDSELANRWSRGLANGTDPESDEYWGPCQDRDQRMVELCAIGFALAYAPETFWEPLAERERRNVAAWVGSLNSREMPDTNWRWFRVMANLGLRAVGASEFSAATLESDLNFMESFHLSGGWLADGPRKPLEVIANTTRAPEGQMQCDYYSTGFALQLVPLVYAKLAGQVDAERAKVFRQRAQAVAMDMAAYFDEDGRAIAFGRSMTYRFAQAGFWSGAAFAEIDLPAPLGWDVMKGLYLRHLRWWSSQPIFNEGGTLSIGYAYSNNLFITEDYNSPGSPYWACLAYLPLALAADHAFWTEKEEALPVDKLPSMITVPHIGHALIRAREGGLSHTFLLSAGQSPHYPMRAGASKYGKDAYSSAFGYSVPTGIWGLQQLGADSTLAVCVDSEADAWTVRRQAFESEAEHDTGRLSASWRACRDVSIRTFLYPPSSHDGSPFWYIRAHRVRIVGHGGYERWEMVDGAFALHANTGKGEQRLVPASDKPQREGQLQTDSAALASSRAGVVGIRNLGSAQVQTQVRSIGDCVRGDANSNLVAPRSVIPSIRHHVKRSAGNAGATTVWLVTAVFAIATRAGSPEPLEPADWLPHWNAPPSVPAELTQRMMRDK